MKFCKECGKELKEGAVFCNECGTPVNGQKPADTGQNQEQMQTQSKIENPFKNMSKRTERILIASAAAVVVLFGAYKIGENLTSKEHLVKKFETALQKHDAKAVAKLLSSNDKKLKIDEKSVKGLITYFKENPDAEASLIKDIKEQSKALDKMEKLDNKDQGKLEEMGLEALFEDFAYDENGFVNLEKDGKVLFYDKYELNVEPVYLSIYTNYKDTEILVNGKKVAKANKPEFEKTFGPFVPGMFEFEGKLKTNFVELNDKYSDVLTGTSSKQNVEIYLDGEDVSVELPQYAYSATSAKLLVNGKDTGLNLKENNRFGPVKTDGSMSIQAILTTPWGEFKSEEVAIDNEYVSLDFPGNGVQVELPYNVPDDFAAELIVDGKKTGINLAENNYFGPIMIDITHTFAAEVSLPWGTVKTKETMIDNDYFELEMINDDLIKTLMDTSVKTSNEWVKAIQSGDVNSLTVYSTEEKERLKEDINSYKEEKQGFTGSYLESIFYKDKAELEYVDNHWEATILVNAKFNSDWYYEGGEANTEVNDNLQYQTFVYDETTKTWLLNQTNHVWSYIAEGLQGTSKKVEKPISVTSSWVKPTNTVAAK